MKNERRRNLDFKKRTGRLIDRLTYCPAQHKRKYTKKLREKLQARRPTVPDPEPSQASSLKFGSININGLDLEASWAVDQLISNRGYDVGIAETALFMITDIYDRFLL